MNKHHGHPQWGAKLAVGGECPASPLARLATITHNTRIGPASRLWKMTRPVLRAATWTLVCPALPMRVGFPSLLKEPSPQVISAMRISRRGGAPGTPGACITPPPAPSPLTLTLRGGFTVLDSDQRRLHRHAHAQGYSDLGSYLQARCEQQASPAQLASELGTTTTVVRHLLDQAGITPSPRQVTAAHTRRGSTDEHLAARAAELGFASLQDYLADRAVTRRWPTTSIASELGVQPATVRDRLDQHGLPRQRASVRPHRAIQRQTECWAAKRQARLAGLGFASVEEYLRVRRVEQGWSLRRMLAELQVGPAWLKDQLHRLDIP
jgi:hypothetical protein